MPIPGQMDSVTFEGEGPGAKRIFAINNERLGGGFIVEELVSIDETHRSYEYRMADNGPLPWTGYIGEISVTPCGALACAIRLSADITSVGVSDEE